MENTLNKIRKIGLALLTLLLGCTVQAHQAEFSTSLLSKTENGTYLLQITSSLSAFQGEIDYLYGQKGYKTPEEFKKLVIEHFYKNVQFTVNGDQLLTLKDPMVLLGHETKIIVEVLNMPKEVSQITFVNTMFREVSTHNKMGVIMMAEGFPKQQFVLENENKQTIDLELADGEWIDNQSGNLKMVQLAYAAACTILFMIPVLFIGYRDRKKFVGQ